MSGLLWQALGGAVANSANIIGTGMMRDYEEQRRLALEELKDKRLLERQIELEKAKDAIKEADAKKDAGLLSQAEQKSEEIGFNRRFAKWKGDLGETALSEDEQKEVFKKNYDQKFVGNSDGADAYYERTSKAKADVLNEIRKLGASSTAIKAAQDDLRLTQQAESESDRQRNAERKSDLQYAQLNEQLRANRESERQRDEANRIREKGVDVRRSGGGSGGSRTEPVEKPATTADIQRQINSARDTLATELGVPKDMVDQRVAKIKSGAAAGNATDAKRLEAIQPFIDELELHRGRMRDFKRPADRAEPSKPAPAGKPFTFGKATITPL